ncbi:hypothetical protein G6F70_007693 [Rhizopus microsporus]|nr:hypothetical protein G6F71_007648 [Rhizopus microsporus]KAG1196119.1 hypothetical protein G6F70_007693 [Rhizopus microsporus]KAG1215724.1 hypothetical protein G6F69_000711 [Rhizopus microsporus]KAG1229084.1 hypothetical protein G6F67_007397 [Rhizopus microsporus]KAG1260941.1 hypothetical protein G6F68_007062 [Rhizopus microsporus]
MTNHDIERIKNLLGTHEDFPKKGIVFKDMFPVFKDPTAVEALISNIVHHINSTYPEKIDAVVGLDARGFLFGPLIALRLGAAFVPVRKQGKLPGDCVQATYQKEYGEDIFELQKSALKEGDRVIIVDDLIATGGSAAAAGQLVKQCNAKTVEYVFVMELDFLNGSKTLDAPVYSLIHLYPHIIMEFDEVHTFIKRKSNEEQNAPSLNQIANTSCLNPYNTLQPVLAKRPTFSNFVHKLRQQSTKTRFVRDYKRLANDSLLSDEETDERVSSKIMDANRSIPDSQIENLDISTNTTKPIKRVTIKLDPPTTESENDSDDIVTIEGKEILLDDISLERFKTMEQAIELHQKDIQSIQDRIEYEKRRIEIKKEEIMYFIHSLNNINEQIENYSQSMKSILHNNLPLMKAHQSTIIDNSDKLKYNRKKNLLQKARFDKYRKTINAETRLLELEKKIKIVWKRDEIYAGIRDWGFIVVFILSLLFSCFIIWKS